MDFDFKAFTEKIKAAIKAGSVFIHTQAVSKGEGTDKVLLGETPVLHAQEGNLEALALIHEPVGGAKFITRSTNANYQGTVSTSLRNLVTHASKPQSFKDAQKALGLILPAIYSLHRYGGTQETDSLLRQYNKRIREIDAEVVEAQVKGDVKQIETLYVELHELTKNKLDREFTIKFSGMSS